MQSLSLPQADALASCEYMWKLTDHFFEEVVTSANALKVPISLRQPFLFYLGHLPSFTANTCFRLLDPRPETNATFDHMFSRGIDPDVEDPTNCHDHPEAPSVWPSWHDVWAYKEDVRAKLRVLAKDGSISPRLLTISAEHDAMHLDTLQCMLAQLRRTAPDKQPVTLAEGAEAPSKKSDVSLQWCQVAAGETCRGTASSDPFVWDNELDASVTHVPAFEMSTLPVTIAQFEQFIAGGGYNDRALWDQSAWDWQRRENMQHPVTWQPAPGDGYRVLTTTAARSTADCAELPVSVSLAEARAFATWCGARLPTEFEFQRAAFADGSEGSHLLLAHEPADEPGDVRDGAVSWCGIVGLVGNGWELTDTVFEAFEGFKPMDEYMEYSTDFFDGKHFVLKGASWATSSIVVRKSFRNFYQALYPYVFSKFRLVRDV